MNTTTCPICEPIFDAIHLTNSLGDLDEIRSVRIPHAKGISGEQRGELLSAAAARETYLLNLMNVPGF